MMITLSQLKNALKSIKHTLSRKAEAPDWSENNPNSLSYVKNRIGGYRISNKIVKIPREYLENTMANLEDTENHSVQMTGSAAIGEYSFAEGEGTAANGHHSHAEGKGTAANGDYSHAEGSWSIAEGHYSHAEGSQSIAEGNSSHAEGEETAANGDYSHAEGYGSIAEGESSHSEGEESVARGWATHAEGMYTEEVNDGAHVQGMYNVVQDVGGTLIHIVGNGDEETRSNAHTLDKDGTAWYQGNVYVGSTGGTNKDGGSKRLATEEYVDSKCAEAGGGSGDSDTGWIQADAYMPRYYRVVGNRVTICLGAGSGVYLTSSSAQTVMTLPQDYAPGRELRFLVCSAYNGTEYPVVLSVATSGLVKAKIVPWASTSGMSVQAGGFEVSYLL